METRCLLVPILSVVLALQGWSQASSEELKRPAATGDNRIDRTDAAVSQTSFVDEKPPAALPDKCPDNDCCGKLFCCNMCPNVYGEVEGLFLTRSPGHPERTILIDGNTQQTLLSSSDLNFDWSPGVRALFGFRLCGCWGVEFGYFGLFNARASEDFVQPNPNVDVTLPGDLGVASNVFHDGVRVRVDYVSRLQGAEVNFPYCCCWECCDGGRAGSTEWFAGFRYLSLREHLRISGERTVAQLPETGFYETESRNDLFGAQLGARIRRCLGQFSWEATGKAGIFGNQAGQEQVFIDFPNFPLRPQTSASGGSTAFVGELNLTGIYQLNRVWALRAGYNLMWIEGVALAPDQLDFTFTSTSGTGLNRSGSLFLHGVNVGLEARW